MSASSSNSKKRSRSEKTPDVPRLTATQVKLLERIQERFQELFETHGMPPCRTKAEVTRDPQLIHQDFQTYGFANVVDWMDKDVFVENQRGLIRELSIQLFGIPDPSGESLYRAELERISAKYPDFTFEEKSLASLTSWWNAKNGFGNCNFRFIYFQFLAQSPRFPISGEDVEFSYNPIHRLTLRLIARHPEIWNLLKSFHPTGLPMVSWDSQKVRFQDVGKPLSKISKSTTPTLTVPHRDIYKHGGYPIERIQAMLISQNSRAISLGWVAHSSDPLIQELISAFLGKPVGGYSTVDHPALVSILNKYWYAPQGFVIWKQETIHYEAVPDPVNRSFVSFQHSPDILSLFSFRLVIGTQIPLHLDRDALTQLAYLAEHGWCPEMYSRSKPHNKSTKVFPNIVNTKSTQYMIPRQPSSHEQSLIEKLQHSYSLTECQDHLNQLPLIIKEMYGIYD